MPRAPAIACVLIDAGGADARSPAASVIAQVEAALVPGGPPVIVLWARGEPLSQARASLRALDRLLAPVTTPRRARTSRSATDGLAAWAASLDGPIGIDVQCAPASLDHDLLDAALTPDERRWLDQEAHPAHAFARLWAAKEAVLKAFGVGLAWPPREVCVLPVAAGWQGVEVRALGRASLAHLETASSPQIALAVALNAGFAAPA